MNRGSLGLVPPTQAGGWMIDETTANITSAPTLAVPAVSRKPVPAITVNCQLLGCLQGLLVNRNYLSSQSSSAPWLKGLDSPEEATAAYAADITMFPEGLKRGTSNSAVSKLLPQSKSNSNPQSSVEWSKRFTYPLLFSLQQTQVSFMKITVYTADSVKSFTSPSGKDAKKIIFGFATLDMSSFNDTDGTAQMFLLPVKAHSKRKEKELIRGWLVLGLQHFANKNSSAPSVTSAEIDKKAAFTWQRILSDPTIASTSSTEINSSVEKSLQMTTSRSKLLADASNDDMVVHVALGLLELTRSVLSDLQSARNEVIYVQIRGGVNNDPLRVSSTNTNANTGSSNSTWTQDLIPDEHPGSDSAIAVLNRTTGQLEWDTANVAVVCAVNVIFTQVLYVAMYRGERAGSCIDTSSSTYIGEAVLILSKSSLCLGAPINIVSPLRDVDGTRVAILHIGAHKTAVLPMGTPLFGAANMRATSTLLLDRQMTGNTVSEDSASISLTVCIEDGSVIDPAWRQAVEPFFELTLVPPRGGITTSDRSTCRARTGFVGCSASTYMQSSLNKQRWSNQLSPTDMRTAKTSLLPLSSSRTTLTERPLNPWGLVCTLQLPREGFPIGPADEMGKPMWALAVVCRDASRAGCPEIAFARVGLPWSLLARGRSTDQWVVLFDNLTDMTDGSQPGNSSIGMDMMMRGTDGADSLSSLGRVRLKIVSKPLDNPNGTQLAAMRSKPRTGISTLQRPQSQSQSQVTLGTLGAPANVPTTTHALVKTVMHSGIGATLIWLKGLTKIRSGQEIEPLNITMASATSLVMSGYAGAYYEEAGCKEDKERITFSELVFGRYGNSSESSNVTRSAATAWGEDWMAGVPGLDGMCGSLPVAGGHSVLRLGISVASQKLPFTASFSVLSGISKGSPNGSEYSYALDIPSLDILVSAHDDDDILDNKQSTRGSFAQELRVTVKSVPRLKLWTAFVPFVRGRLTVCCRSVRFPTEVQQMRRFPDGRAHRCALRFTMSNESFGYSAAFDIPLTADTVVTASSVPHSTGDNDDTNGYGSGYGNVQSFKSLGTAQTSASDQSTRTFKNGTAAVRSVPMAPGRLRTSILGAGFGVTLPIDTLDLTTRGGSCSMLTLQITLLDLDESGSSYLVGMGGVQTAPLYHQALKSASSSAPPSPESDGSTSVNVGVSQWATSECTVYNTLQQPVAWVTLSTQFAMEGLSSPVVSALQAARQSPDVTCAEDEGERGMARRMAGAARGPRESSSTQVTSNTYASEPEDLHLVSQSRAVTAFTPESALKTAAVGGAEKARTELGLKQAFLVADTDRSGSVSVDELIAVIKQSGIKVPRSQSRTRSRSGTGSGTRTAVGMEDTVALLLGLAGDTIDLATLKRSDLLDTGDSGLEQTVRRIFSRLDVDGDGMISWWEWQASLSGALLGRHPNEKFIDPLDGLAVIAQAADDALSFKTQQTGMRGEGFSLPDLWDIPYIDPGDTARIPLTVSNAGSVTRLQQKVSSLRLSAVLGASSAVSDNALVAAAVKKQMEAEAAAHDARQGHREETRRRVDLEASLLNLKRLNDAVKGAREDKDQTNRQLSDALSADAAVHKNKLSSMTANKRKRLKASLTIALFLRRVVIPRHRRMKQERGRAVICRALLGAFHRKHFLKTMDLRIRATSLLQKRVRGVLGRMRLRRLKEAAVKVQRVYRGSRGRDKYQKMLINRAAIRFSKQYCAAEKLKSAMQRFIQRLKASRNKAAITIQSAMRERAACKVLSGRRNDEAMVLLMDRRAQEEAQRQHHAAYLIGKMARDRSAIRTARNHRNRLLLERTKREEDIEQERSRALADGAVRSAEEKRRAERESKAAILIQAASRGRSGRKRHSRLKDRGAAQQQRLARYQLAAKYMRAVLPKPAVKNATGSWVRFQKKHERATAEVETETNTPAGSPREDSRPMDPGCTVAPSSPRRRSIVGPSQPLISPRSSQAAAPIAAGPLLIQFRDLSYIEIGTKVEALYGSESTWFPGKVVRVVSVPLPESNKSAPSSSSPRKKKVQSIEEDGVEEVLYDIMYDDGDEETCSRGKIRVPECKEKQPGVLAISQEVHALCTSAEITLRGRVLGGPFRPQGIGVLAEGAGAGTGGGAGPEDEYDILFFLDEEKEQSVTERVKRKYIIAPHLSAALVSELKEREAERNEEKVRQEAFAARQVVVKKTLSSPRKMELFTSPRWEALVAVSVSRGEGPDHSLIGEVTRVDKHRRIIHTQLLNASTLDFYTVELPYDHPRLLWFSYDPSDGDIGGVEEILDLDESPIPHIEEVLDGYYVSYPVDGQAAERCGQVVSVIKDKKAVVLYFQDTINGLITDVTETIPYDTPNLSWYKDESRGGDPPLMSWVAQPALRDATGYLVEIRSLEPDALQGDMFAGEIVAVDDKTNTILVSFDCNGEEEDDEDDMEMVPYDSLDIVWVSPPLYLQSLIKRPPLSGAIGCEVDVYNETRSCKNGPKDAVRGRVMSVREGEDTLRVRFKNGSPDEVFPYESMQISWISEAPPSFLSRSAVPRPHLPQAIGYEVEVQVRDEESRDGGERHAYVGEVISVNKETNTLRVRFQGSGDGEDIPDCDDITYFSTDIAWMKKSEPISSRSLVSRPQLEDAVGYIVDVKSHEEDHDHDDVYVGEVVSVDVTAGIMRVLFEGEKGEQGDEEDIEYNSLDVAWMQKKNIPAPRIFSPRSPFIPGKSQSQGQEKDHTENNNNNNNNNITPQATATGKDGAPAKVKSHKAPSAPSTPSPYSLPPASTSPRPLLSLVPRPNILECVGYKVQTKDLTRNTVSGEISAVLLDKCAVLVLFEDRKAIGPRGSASASMGTEHYFDFECSSLGWMEAPIECLLSQSSIPRPPVDKCVGCEVEVQSVDPGSDSSHAYSCRVTSVDIAKRMMRVMFVGHEGDDADEESIPYDSKDVAWKAFKKGEKLKPHDLPVTQTRTQTQIQVDVHTAAVASITRAVKDSTPTSSSSAQQSNTSITTATNDTRSDKHHSTKSVKQPSPNLQNMKKWDELDSKEPVSKPILEEAEGYYIAVSDDDGDIRGRVVGTTKKMLQIILLDEDGEEDDEVLELQHTSSSIRWYRDRATG